MTPLLSKPTPFVIGHPRWHHEEGRAHHLQQRLVVLGANASSACCGSASQRAQRARGAAAASVALGQGCDVGLGKKGVYYKYYCIYNENS